MKTESMTNERTHLETLAADGNPVDKQRWVVVGLLCLGMIIAYVSRGNISVVLALPDFVKSFHLSDTGRGLINSAFFWAYVALQVPAGWVVDRYGVKYPYALGFVFWCMASAGTSFARSVAQLTTLRVILGTFESLVAPASITWIRRNFSETERGFAVGVYLSGTKIGPAVAAPLTVWLTIRYGWHAMFMLVGVGGVIWLLPWLVFVKNDAPQTSSQPQKKSGEAAIPFSRILLSPITWGTVILAFCYMYFVYFCMTWMPAYFIEHRHLSIAKMGTYTFFSFGGMAIMAALSGWVADRMIARGGNPVTVRKWFTIVALVIACTELIGAQGSSVNVALTFAIVSLSGLGLATANYWALTQTLIPASAIGRVSGVVNCSASLAGIAAPIFTGWLKQRSGGYQAPMQAIWFFLVLGALSYLVLMREKYAPRADDSPH